MSQEDRDSSSPDVEKGREQDESASITNKNHTTEVSCENIPYTESERDLTCQDLEKDESVDPYLSGPISQTLSRRLSSQSQRPSLRARALTRIRSGRGDSVLNDYGNSEEDLPGFGDHKPYPPMLNIPKSVYEVGYVGGDDPLHPYNWSMKRKIKVAFCLGNLTFMSAFGSAILASGIPAISEHFHFSEEVGILLLTLYVLGFATGPTLWAPLSELYGRRLSLVISSIGCTIFHFGTATAKDSQTLFLCRFFAGFFAAAPLAVVGAVFSDMFNVKQKGYALIIFSSMVFVGPLLAPVLSGFIVANKHLGWRWTFYFLGIFEALFCVLTILFVDESFAPVILISKASELRAKTGNWAIHASHENMELSFEDILQNNFARPVKMLFLEPLLLSMTIYTSLIYGILYMFLEAYPIVFAEGYGMSMSVHGLPYIGLLIGAFFGCGISAACEPYVQRKYKANGGIPIPEARLLAMCVGSVIFPIGLFWFFWTGNYPEHVHWAVPTVSGLFSGAGLVSIFISAIQYIIESYLTFAASAIAGNTLMRSAVGAVFPLFSIQLFHNLGVQWGGTLVALLATVLTPVPFIFFFYGEKLRIKSRYSPYKAKKPQSEMEDYDMAEDTHVQNKD